MSKKYDCRKDLCPLWAAEGPQTCAFIEGMHCIPSGKQTPDTVAFFADTRYADADYGAGK